MRPPPARRSTTPVAPPIVGPVAEPVAEPPRHHTMWNALLSAQHVGYLGKLFASRSAPWRNLTTYSLSINLAWRLGFVRGKQFAAASSTLGLVMAVTYWTSLAATGAAATEDSTFDALDDTVVHALLPLEAFVLGFARRRVYEGYDSLLEFLFLALLYLPFFVGYRPYAFLDSLSTGEVVGVGLAAVAASATAHAGLSHLSIRLFQPALTTQR